jgi:hypothetical protein
MGKFEDQLLDDLLREHGHTLACAAVPPPPRRRARWAAAVITTAAVVTGVLVLQAAPFGDQPTAPRAVADVLTRAADRIGATDPTVGPGRYLYLESHEWNLVSAELGSTALYYLEESLTQTWVPHDRSEEWMRRSSITGKRKWIQGSDADLAELGNLDRPMEELRARCGDFHLEQGVEPCDGDGTWQEPTLAFVAALPTDPRELYDELVDALEDEDIGVELAILDFVQDAINRGLLPGELRASLYRALALMPGLRISDRDVNVDGRMGIALGAKGAGRVQELIIDPASGQFIGERETTTKGYGPISAGSVTSHTSLTTAVVDELGELPSR